MYSEQPCYCNVPTAALNTLVKEQKKKKKEENTLVILWTFSASEDLQSGGTDSC